MSAPTSPPGVPTRSPLRAEVTTEIGAAVTAHTGAADPHPQYTTDAEALAIAAGRVSAHLAALDPHPEYPTNAEVASLVAPKADVAALAPVAFSGNAQDLTGLLPTSALPALAINDTWTVSTEAAMLALPAQRGDVAIRDDLPATFILAADTPTTLSAWKRLPVPTDAVLSVAGRTGVVVLGRADVGLGQVNNTADVDKPISAATQAALDGKANGTAPAAAVAAHVADADPHPQYLTATEGDARYVPITATSKDWRAARFGCAALTFTPVDISHADPRTIRLAAGRLYCYWLPLPQGSTVTAVRLPINELSVGSGTLEFRVFQEDRSTLGTTGDVAATLGTGAATTWRTLPLAAPNATTGTGVYVAALYLTGAGGSAPSVVFSNTATPLPWVYSDGAHRTAVRLENIAAMPSTLVLGVPNGSDNFDYIDIMIGVV